MSRHLCALTTNHAVICLPIGAQAILECGVAALVVYLNEVWYVVAWPVTTLQGLQGRKSIVSMLSRSIYSKLSSVMQMAKTISIQTLVEKLHEAGKVSCTCPHAQEHTCVLSADMTRPGICSATVSRPSSSSAPGLNSFRSIMMY